MDCFKTFEIVSVSHGAVIKPSVPLCLINNKKNRKIDFLSFEGTRYYDEA